MVLISISWLRDQLLLQLQLLLLQLQLQILVAITFFKAFIFLLQYNFRKYILAVLSFIHSVGWNMKMDNRARYPNIPITALINY